MGIRYIKQRNKHTCGPIAVINILKWLGCKTTYKDFPLIKAMCKCNREGTYSSNVDKTIDNFKIKKKIKRFPHIKDVDTHLKLGGIILFEHKSIFEDISHLALCVGKDNRYYYLVNEYINKTISKVARKTFIQIVTWRSCKKDKPWTWFIYRD